MTDHEPMPNKPDCGGEAAAYVLGALEPAEAEGFRAHLEHCIVCRDEVAALQRVVDALPMAAPQFAAPKGLRRRVMRGVAEDARHARPERRRQERWRLPPLLTRPAFASFAAAVVVAAVIGGIVLGTGGPGSRLISASVGDAQLRLMGGHGDLVVHHLPDLPNGRIYELWVQHGSGSPSPSTLFAVTSRDTADVEVPSNISGVRAVMVTQEPAGGSRVPTTAPVIVARLS